MPKGISELIDFLLEKIALCGEQGKKNNKNIRPYWPVLYQ